MAALIAAGAPRRPTAAQAPPAVPGSNVAALLHARAETDPHAPAVLRADGSVAWTTGELAFAAARGAANLADRDVGPGDVVLVLAPGEAAVAVAATVLWSGAVMAVPPRGPNFRSALRAALATRPRAVIASPAVWAAGLLEPALLRIPVRFVTGARGLPGISALAGRRPTGRTSDADVALRPPAALGEADPAVITFTTGTTGPPRPIVRTHGVLRGQHEALERLRPARPGDVDLAGLPMLVLHDLARGVPAVLPPPRGLGGRHAGHGLAGAVRRLRVTTAGGFPPLFESLADFAPPGGYPDLRAIHVGGAPVAPELVGRLRVIAPNASVTVVYGATEVEPIAAIDGDDYVALAAARRPGDGICVGRLVAGLDLRLAGLAGGGVGDPSAAGRLLVRGPQVAAAPDDPDGWRDVGDLARLDGDGQIWLLGRASSAVGGVPPLAIEQAAEAIVGVRTAAVLPAAGARRPVLAVEVDTGPTGDVVARVRELVAGRWPRLEVVALRALPREARSGKVDSGELTRIVARVMRASRRR